MDHHYKNDIDFMNLVEGWFTGQMNKRIIMKKIEELNFYTRFPLLNYYYFADLKDKEHYLKECSLYNELLLKYLIKNTSIKIFDNDVKNCKDYVFEFEPIKKNLDIYQYLCNEELDFFYIRSNIYPENLSSEEKEFLDSLIDKKDIVYNSEIEKFVKKTFLKVIYENIGDHTPTDLNFGPSSSEEFFAPNDSLVIGGRFDIAVAHIDNDEDLKNYFGRINYFKYECKWLQRKLSEELGIDVRVIYYNDDSIKEMPLREGKRR